MLSQRGVLLLTSSTVRHDTQKCIQSVMTPTVFNILLGEPPSFFTLLVCNYCISHENGGCGWRTDLAEFTSPNGHFGCLCICGFFKLKNIGKRHGWLFVHTFNLIGVNRSCSGVLFPSKRSQIYTRIDKFSCDFI